MSRLRRLLVLYSLVGRVANWMLQPAFVVLTLRSVRIRALIVSQDTNEILLVRSWLGFQCWSLPGGGIKSHEAPSKAAAREVFEETGVFIPTNAFSSLGAFINTDSRAPFMVHCMIAKTAKHPVRTMVYRRHEILDAGWFPLDKLPPKHSKNVDEATALYSKKRTRT
jgi:ADP-ribose pyrophosphatase YjhB (NUDIX family)